MKPSTRARWRALAQLQGLISEDTGNILARLASTVPADQVIVEVGSYKGKSTAYLAEGARLGNGARVYAVDAWGLPGNPNGKHGYNDAFRDFENQLFAIGLLDQVTAVVSHSVQAAHDYCEGKPIGLLFIDADHEYRSVRDDFYAWQPHLAPGAVVAFDDYNTKRNPGVKRFCDELKEMDRLYAWEYFPGLAVGTVPE